MSNSGQDFSSGSFIDNSAPAEEVVEPTSTESVQAVNETTAENEPDRTDTRLHQDISETAISDQEHPVVQLPQKHSDIRLADMEQRMLKLESENARLTELLNAQDRRLENVEDVAETNRMNFWKKGRSENWFRVVLPCKLRILAASVDWFAIPKLRCKVVVEAGQLKTYAPLRIASTGIRLGNPNEIQTESGRKVELAKEGAQVWIELWLHGEKKDYNTNFVQELLVSEITAESIALCKEYYVDKLSDKDWELMEELSKPIEIKRKEAVLSVSDDRNEGGKSNTSTISKFLKRVFRA